MGSKYYISVRPQTNDLHAVHKVGCPFLPQNGKRIFLGEFNKSSDAVRIGSLHFRKVIPCLFCCKEKTAADNTIKEQVLASGRISSKVSASYQQDMICCVN
jgi:hypothetical protein